ncbi:Uncharacterized conserved protein, DUF58 family, contains vWF domain [Caldanaerobius fijiensis DSM 17918]|uniref:Uncharacterized conserved protein, DUF58 family, contains vWF domain n=1 Tax=Caldanaerobius fijiensis DSM 17918 TaxID=1121256 RepID=A0A1M5F4M3_9THEO|nr:DUF58 domain-containing protein [Caldanaerobius fijiensis]SHF86042.1 Uncharacterized conserved protein, DUF58 family, contains vWF domain [Caldanaerobius fijiensis DSM 17918]
MEFIWLIIAVLIIVYAQDVLFSRYALKNLSYDCWFEQDGVFEGEDVRFIERFTNNKVLPVLWLKVRIQMPLELRFYNTAFVNVSDKQYYQRIFSLWSYQQVMCRHLLSCIKRGYYTVDQVDLVSGDLLRGNRSYKTIAVNRHLLVYPRFIDIEEVLIPARLIQGDFIVKRWIVEDPFLVTGYRDYQPTDSLNKINWLATARLQKLQVAKHDFTASSSLIIALNVEYQSAWVDHEVLELIIRLCASLAQKSVDNGIPVAVMSNGLQEGYDEPTHLEIPLGSSCEHMRDILEGLARLSFEYQSRFSFFLSDLIQSIPYNADLMILTSYIDEAIASVVEDIDKDRISVSIATAEEDWDRYSLRDVNFYLISKEGELIEAIH